MTRNNKLRISEGPRSSYVISLIDVTREDHAEAVALVTDGQAQATNGTPGFEGGIVLANDDRERIVTITRWDSHNDYLASLLDESGKYQRDITALAKRVRARGYRLLGAHDASGLDKADVFANPDLHCCVIWGEAHDIAKRDFILNYNLWETERHMQTLSGFRFATFFAGHDPLDFAELTQWETTAQFEAAYADPGFQEHIPPNNHYCEKDISFHRVVATTSI